MRTGDVGDDADRLPRPRSAQEQPVDLEAVRADDDLIEALAAGLVKPPTRRPDPGDVDEQLVALLSSWVADVRPESLLHRPADPWAIADGQAEFVEPINGIASVDPVAAVLDAAVEAPADPIVTHTAASPGELRPSLSAIGDPAVDDTAIGEPEVGDAAAETRPIPRVPVLRVRREIRPLQQFAAAAAFIALAGSGLVIGAWDAKPGTALWPVTSVVFAEKASSVQAAVDVVSNLTRARAALDAHHPAEAQSAYQDALDRLAAVAPAEGHAALVQETSVIALQFGFPAPTAAQPGVLDSDNRSVLAAGSAATTGNTSVPSPDTDSVLAAGGAAPGNAADPTLAAGVPAPPPDVAPARGQPSADVPGSRPGPPDATTTAAAPAPLTDVDPPSSAPNSADPTSAVPPGTAPNSTAPNSSDPTGADPTTAVPPSADPVSTDPGSTDPSHFDPSGTHTTGDETTGDGTTDATGSETPATSGSDN